MAAISLWIYQLALFPKDLWAAGAQAPLGRIVKIDKKEQVTKNIASGCCKKIFAKIESQQTKHVNQLAFSPFSPFGYIKTSPLFRFERRTSEEEVSPAFCLQELRKEIRLLQGSNG